MARLLTGSMGGMFPVGPTEPLSGGGRQVRIARSRLTQWLALCEALWNELPIDSPVALLAARLADQMEASLCEQPLAAWRRRGRLA